MPSFQCQMCGSTVQYQEGQKECRCKLCGFLQAVPDPAENKDIASSLDYMVLDTEEDAGAVTPPDTLFKSFDRETGISEEVFRHMAHLEGVQVLDEDEDSVDEEAAQEARKNAIYFAALAKMGPEDIESYRAAMEAFESILPFKDADERIEECKEKIRSLEEAEEEIRLAEQKKQKETRTLLAIGIPFTVLLLCICLVAAFSVYPNSRYKKALALSNEGNVVEAYETFAELNGYKDSDERAAALFASYKIEKLSFADIGDEVYFGAFEQDGNVYNGKEDLLWRVLDKEDGKLLLMSVYGLDCYPFQVNEESVTWETSDLRRWLNHYFIDEAFDKEQLAQIVESDLPEATNPDYPTSPGPATKDKVFVPSYMETKRYLPTRQSRCCVPTSYSLKKGTTLSDTKYYGNYTACWMLRSPGFDDSSVVYVQYEGNIRTFGGRVNSGTVTVRPFMWISVK